MKNKQTTRIVVQTLLIMITTFIILEFYQYDAIPYMVKWTTTIALIVVNAVYNHWCGLQNGIEMGEGRKKYMRELREQSYNKIVDMVVEEKTNDKAVE